MGQDRVITIRLSADAAAAVKPLQSLAQVAAQTSQQIKRSLNAIGEFEKLKSDVTTTSTALATARAEVTKLHQEIAKAPTDHFAVLSRDFSEATEKSKLLERQLDQQTSKLNKASQAVRQLGVDINETGAAQARLGQVGAEAQYIQSVAAARRLLGVQGFDDVQAKIKQLGEAYKLLGEAGFKSFGEQKVAAEAYARQLAALKAKVGELTKPSILSSAGSRLGTAASVGVGIAGYAAVSGAVDFAKDAAQTALQFDQIDRALKALTGSESQAKAEMAFLRAESERLGLSVGALAPQFLSLIASAHGTAIEGQGVRDLFTAISEASTVLGLSNEQTQGTFAALGQMMSKGTVQAEELRGQMGERLYGAFQIAARSMGWTTAQLGEMLQKGQVVTDVFVPKFAAEVHKSFGVAAVQSADSARASFNRLDNAITELKLEFAGSGFLDSLADGAKDLTAQFKDPAFRESVKELGRVLGFLVAHANTVIRITLAPATGGASLVGPIGDAITNWWKTHAQGVGGAPPAFTAPDGGASTSAATPAPAAGGPTTASYAATKDIGSAVAAHQIAAARIAEASSLADLDKALRDGNATIEKYYAERQRIQQKAIDVEIKAKQDEMAAFSAAPVDASGTAGEQQKASAQRAAEWIKLQTELADLRAKRGQVEKENDKDLEAAQKSHLERLVEIRQQYAAITKDAQAAGEAARQALTLQYADDLKKPGADKAGIQKIIDVGAARAEFEQLQASLQTLLGGVEQQWQTMSAAVQAGALGSANAQEKFNNSLAATTPAMVALLPQLHALADVLGQDAVQAVDALEQRMKGLGAIAEGPIQQLLNSWKDATGEMQRAGAGWLDTATNDLTQFITTGKADFKGLADSIIADLIRIQIRKFIAGASEGGGGGLAQFIIGMVGNIAGAVGGGGGSTVDASYSSPAFGSGVHGKYADGGLVTGPGGATEDKVLARLSPGEGILNAKAMGRVGVNALNALNAGKPLEAIAMLSKRAGGLSNLSRSLAPPQIPAFANGGVVGTGPRAGPGYTGTGAAGTTLHLNYAPTVDARGADPSVLPGVARLLEANNKALEARLLEILRRGTSA
jgi:tape measure domain-containing protein